MLPKSLRQLIDDFSGLPGIGPKSATRIAFYLQTTQANYSQGLAQHLLAAREQVKQCHICFNFADTDTCVVCEADNRNLQQIMVVENPLDIIAFENTQYRGMYHVLGGLISPLQGIGPEQIKVSQLCDRIAVQLDKPGDESIEVIMACSTSLEGDATCTYIAELCKRRFMGAADHRLRLSRIARGLPTNSAIEYQDANTLQSSLLNRNPVKE